MSSCRRWSSSWLEHIAAETPVPQDVEKPVEFLKAFSQDRVQLLENPAIPLAEKIVELLVILTEEKTRQGVNAGVQHVVNAVEVEKYNIIEETVQKMKPIIQEKSNQETKRIKIPLLQFTDKVADIPLVAQRQICVNQEVQKTIEDLQLQYTLICSFRFPARFRLVRHRCSRVCSGYVHTSGGHVEVLVDMVLSCGS